MSELKVLPSKRYTIAGKVFILGEYAVLAGLPAVVAAVGPRFEWRPASNGPATHPPQATSGSPLDRFLKSIDLSIDSRGDAPSFQINDPFQGAGGFGASTAEFALAYRAYQNQNPARDEVSGPQWKSVLQLYRKLMAPAQHEESIPPSGADLVAQWQGGVVFFDPSGPYCMDLWPLLDWSGLMVFSATGIPGRKVATHTHLSQIFGQMSENPGKIEKTLEPILSQGVSAIREGSHLQLGQAMSAYADALGALGLEAPEAHEDRKALSEIPGVLGVKGSGALLSDVVLVLVESGSKQRTRILEKAQSRGLKLIADGLTCQMGILCQDL